MIARAVSGLMILTAAFGCLAACGDASDDVSAVEPATEGGVLAVEEVVAPDFRVVAAVLTNRDVGDARARIGGKLSRLLVRDGDIVTKGQVIAVITDERFDAEIRAADAAVTAARANAERATQDLERAEKLYASQAVSRAALDAARAESSSAGANLNAAQAQAAAARTLRDQGRVAAPADGRVTRAPTPQGAIVMPGEVVVAISTGAQVLRIEIPETDGQLLREGDQLRIIADADQAGPQYATVRQVYPAVTRGRVTADLDVPGLSQDLIGARVRVALPVGERPAIVIPESYIVTRYGADYVRLQRAGGAVIEAPVQRGAMIPLETMSDGVEILSGLRPGDRILPAGPDQ